MEHKVPRVRPNVSDGDPVVVFGFLKKNNGLTSPSLDNSLVTMGRKAQV